MKNKKVLLSALAILYFGATFGQTVYTLPTTSWTRVASTQKQNLDALLVAEKQKIKEVFNVSVNFNIGQNPDNLNKVVVSFDCPTQNCDGEIWLGKQVVDKYLDNSKGPDLHTAAHEAAHVVQQRAGVSLKGTQRELHANFLTGYYIGKLGNVSSRQLDSFISNYYSKIDVSTLNASSTERSCAFKEGFKIAQEQQRNLQQSILYGAEFVLGKTVCKN